MGTIKRSFHSTLKYVVRTSVMNCTQFFHFPTAKGFTRKISVKLVYQCMAIYFNSPPTSSNFHPLQVENCDSNLRLVVDEDHNGKFRQTNNPRWNIFFEKRGRICHNTRRRYNIGWTPWFLPGRQWYNQGKYNQILFSLLQHAVVPILNRFTNPERFFRTRSAQTRTRLTKPANLPAWRFSRWILNRFAKLCVSLAQTVSKLSVNLYLESDCQTRWFLWLKLFLDWRQLCFYHFAYSGIQNEANRITKLCWDQCESNMA